MSDELENVIPAIEEPAQPKIYGGWATIGMGVGIILTALVAVQLLVACGARALVLIFNMSPLSGGLVTALSSIATGISGLALTDQIVRMNGSLSLRKYIGLNRLSWKIVLLALAAFLIAVVCILGIGFLYEFIFGVPESTNADFMEDILSGAGWLLMFVATVIFASFFEEVLFRGFIFVGLLRSRLGVAGAIALTSLVWTLLHLQYDLFGMFTICVMGIVLGVTRYKTGSLWSAFPVERYGVLYYATGKLAPKQSQLLLQNCLGRLNQHVPVRENNGRYAAISLVEPLHVSRSFTIA